MEPICHDAGYQLLVVTSGDDEAQELAGIEHLVARQVDALMIVPSSTDAGLYRKWSARLPLFLVDRRLPGLPYAVTDAEDAVTRMVYDALADEAADEAYYFGGQPHLSPSVDRLNGFRAALKEAGVAEQAGWVRARDYRRLSGYAMMQECYRELGRYPRVLFTGSITLLEGALEFISENRHFDVAPQRIITFDDHPLLDCLPLRIDAMAQDSAALARASLDCLLSTLGVLPPENASTACAACVPAILNWRSRKAAGVTGIAAQRPFAV